MHLGNIAQKFTEYLNIIAIAMLEPQQNLIVSTPIKNT